MGRTKVAHPELGVVHYYHKLMELKPDSRILEVCALWEICPPVKDKGGHLVVPQKFYTGLQRLGWKTCPQGAFKQAYKKKDLVVKFMHLQNDDEYRDAGLDREWAIWRRSKGKKRNHLAACILYYDWKLLFQKRVPRLCNKFGNCRPARLLSSAIRMNDWEQNHGHTRNNKTIFFDYDNSGSYYAAVKARRKLLWK